MWSTKIEREAGNALEIFQVWLRDGSLARPVRVATLDHANSNHSKLIYEEAFTESTGGVAGLNWQGGFTMVRDTSGVGYFSFTEEKPK